MNTVKIVYIISATFTEALFFIAAIIIPFYLDGSYWWTAGCILLMFGTSLGFTKRLNSWGDMGNVK